MKTSAWENTRKQRQATVRGYLEAKDQEKGCYPQHTQNSQKTVKNLVKTSQKIWLSNS